MGNALNFIGQMKVIRVAKAYISVFLPSIHIPSSLLSTECVSKAFRLRISTSGNHKLRKICRLTAVKRDGSGGSCSVREPTEAGTVGREDEEDRSLCRTPSERVVPPGGGGPEVVGPGIVGMGRSRFREPCPLVRLRFDTISLASRHLTMK